MASKDPLDESASSSSTSSSSSSLCGEKKWSCSKAQNCMFKILRIITTVPPENTVKVQSLSSSQLEEQEFVAETEFVNGFAVDLNVGFCVSPGSPAAGSVKCELGSCSEVEVKTNDGGIPGAGEEIVEISQLESNKPSKVEKLEEEKGFMGLLIEAARLIFGEFKDEGCEFEPEPEKKSMNSGSRTKQLKRRTKCWGIESVDGKCSSSPVVRSKRGRIQVLPYKYRDSVIQPLTRFSKKSIYR